MFRRREIEERLHARENLLLIHLLQNKNKKKLPKPKSQILAQHQKHTHTHTQTEQTKEQCQRSPEKEKTEKTQQRKCDLLQPTNIPNTNLQQKQIVTKARRGFFLFPGASASRRDWTWEE
jgi:hypothetical protein